MIPDVSTRFMILYMRSRRELLRNAYNTRRDCVSLMAFSRRWGLTNCASHATQAKRHIKISILYDSQLLYLLILNYYTY